MPAAPCGRPQPSGWRCTRSAHSLDEPCACELIEVTGPPGTGCLPDGPPPATEPLPAKLDAEALFAIYGTPPHCDGRVIHAPGACRYCDARPELQARPASDGDPEGVTIPEDVRAGAERKPGLLARLLGWRR